MPSRAVAVAPFGQDHQEETTMMNPLCSWMCPGLRPSPTPEPSSSYHRDRGAPRFLGEAPSHPAYGARNPRVPTRHRKMGGSELIGHLILDHRSWVVRGGVPGGRHTASGQTNIWMMDGAQRIGQGSPGTANPVNWQVAATGDFDADDRSDILWRHTATGQVVIWLMDGTQMVGGGSAGSVGLEWTIAGTGDFNGEHRSLRWRGRVVSFATLARSRAAGTNESSSVVVFHRLQ